MAQASNPETIYNFIGGEWTASSATDSLRIENPATREVLGRVPLSPPADVAAAVAAASLAFPTWRETPAVERARILFRLKQLLEENVQEISRSLTLELGKNLIETRGELQRGIENVEHACGIPTLMMGESLEDIAPGIDCVTYRQPLGVFAAITPYNFPVMIPMWFWPYAVAAGNTFILKPSEQDPLTHQMIVDLAIEAGLPPGVLNVVHGAQETVTALLEHPGIAGISFVGSSKVARLAYAKAAAAGKRVQALGGAKNHMVVLPDADFNATNEALIGSLFGSAGQRCLAGSVVVGVGAAYNNMRERFLDSANSLEIGYGLDEATEMGPVISKPHKERVLGYIDAGESEGAKLVLDGRNVTVNKHPRGHWVGPTVFENVNASMKIGSDEIFGPVAGLIRAKNIDEAVDLIQQVEFGNATSIFTSSGKAAREFRYRAGISMIGVNVGVAAPMAFFPFGGARGSFYGDLKAQGSDAISFYTDRRVVIERW